MLRVQLEIQDLTFSAISHEIHDNVGQILSLAKVQLNLLSEEHIKEGKLLTDAKENISNALIDQDGGTTVVGTYLEATGLRLVSSSGSLHLNSIFLGGGTQTGDSIYQSGPDMLAITDMSGVSTPGAGKCLIQYDGIGSGAAQGVSVSNSYVQAVGAGKHAICVGTGATSSRASSISGNRLITSEGDNIVIKSFTGAYSVTGNAFTGGAYNIDATGMADGKLIVNGNNFATGPSGVCNGCTYDNSFPGVNLVANTVSTYFPGIGTRSSIGACTAARYGLSYPISDADTVVYNATVVGGGANKLNIWCDGTNWKAH
jgi:hypothetical protein